jgi:hypothetical protein
MPAHVIAGPAASAAAGPDELAAEDGVAVDGFAEKIAQNVA